MGYAQIWAYEKWQLEILQQRCLFGLLIGKFAAPITSMHRSGFASSVASQHIQVLTLQVAERDAAIAGLQDELARSNEAKVVPLQRGPRDGAG